MSSHTPKTSSERHLYQYQSGRFKVSLFYPNSYQTAMASLGFQTVYHCFNSQPEFSAERIYWDNSGRPSASVSGEILALSISYELDILNFIKALIKWGIEPFADKRSGPLIVTGGILTLINPLPLAPFVDLFLIGDGEHLIPRFRRTYQRYYLEGKAKLLEELSKIEGCWAPALGKPQNITPVSYPRSSPLHSAVITPDSHFGDMFLIEAGRGCPRKCRFCASCHIHRYEYHPPADLIETVKRHINPPALVGLIGSALSDYPYLKELIGYLAGNGYKISTSSLRVDAVDDTILKYLVNSGMRTLTIAPEAGSLRLRRIIGKGMSDALIKRAVKKAREAGFNRLKLYFMIGLPGETDSDIDALIKLVEDMSEIYNSGGLELSLNAFIPKPHTPFQWAPFRGEPYLKKVRKRIKQALPKIKFIPRSSGQEKLQALLSLGDERIGTALYENITKGISIPAVLKDLGVNIEETLGLKGAEYQLPWRGFQSIFDTDFLYKQWRKAQILAELT
ncbi:radical SAM protein [bacterium]|nr:radical SAM protein [FCB group bacterium]MBL7190114.1 radical SAM protein [bacterium]